MAFEWVAGLFQADNQQTRGLSGDSAHSVALDDSNPYYNYRLRRHKAEGDLVADPGLLWYTSPYVKRRSGLGTHVGAEIGDGTANYTDVLLILSKEDFLRASAEWQQSAQHTLQQEFENFCRRESFARLHAHRPLGVRILEDGSPSLGGHSLDLARGEFVTGLLPNLYTGPVRGSFPVIGVHVNLPGVWEGYQEVGRLYNDQILFTLGSHWLDNFCHPSLQQAALYRLRQYPDGSFVHIVNPDLQDQYQVTSTNQGGASVLTLATRAGQPLAYLVLAVIDPPSTRPTRPANPIAASRPDIHMPLPPANPRATPAAAQHRPDNGVPSIAPPMLLDDDDLFPEDPPQQEKAPPSNALGGKTIIPDAPSERIFTLQERGALLQKVHFSAFMLGYDVYLGSRGELGTHVEDPAATFMVRKRSVSLVSHIDGVVVGGRPVPAGVEVPIDGDVRIEVAGQQLEYRDLRGLKVDGWPYVGEIRRPASSTYMIWGEDYQVGRSRECRVVLPDEPRNDNIHWKPSIGDGATIRARTGEIPKSRFYTDSIMVASEHATVDLRSEGPQVVCTARHCYIYVRRGNEVLPLYPANSPQEPKEADLLPGDEVLVGNCLFHVGFTPSDEGVKPGPAPRVELSADSLADVVENPDITSLDGEEEPPLVMHTDPPSGPLGTQAHGEPPPLGRQSHQPHDAPRLHDRPPPIVPEPTGPDSILYEGELEPLSIDRPLVMGEEDEPTAPGMALPRGQHDATWEETTPFEAPTSPDTFGGEPETQPAGRWEYEDLSESDAPRSVPLADDEPPSSVPAPFPELDPENPDDTATLEDASLSRASRVVVFTDDTEAQFELGRPMHFILAGWSVNGEVLCGNHRGADLIIPENRIVESQAFAPVDYFRLRIRGKRGKLHLLAPSELLIDESDPQQLDYEDPEAHVIDVIRRDESGEEDFAVRLRILHERALPDPRARFVSLDVNDSLAAALVTRGLPRGQTRTLEIEGIRLNLFYDREVVTISDYLETYRQGDTFRPFFVQRDGQRFKTAPEDGASFDLTSGDRLVIGHSVYVLREE